MLQKFKFSLCITSPTFVGALSPMTFLAFGASDFGNGVAEVIKLSNILIVPSSLISQLIVLPVSYPHIYQFLLATFFLTLP